MAMFEVLASDVAFRLDQTFRKEPTLAEGRKLISDWLKLLQDRFGPGSLRYLAAAEYGSKKGRLHWHIILCFSGPKGSAATVRAIRAEARSLFGHNTARLLKRPGDKQGAADRSVKVAYAVKQTVGYALKGSKLAAPFLRDEKGEVRKDKNGKPMKMRVKRFTRSQGWGRNALQGMIDRTPVWRDVIAAFTAAGFPPVFLSLRAADGQRYWLPAKANPLAPVKETGVTYQPDFAPDLDQEDTPPVAIPVRDGYAQGEGRSFDPAAARAARAAHKFADNPANLPVRPSVGDPPQKDWVASILERAEAQKREQEEQAEDEWDADLGPAPHVPVKPKNPSRLPPLSYARRDEMLRRSAWLRRKRYGKFMPDVIRAKPEDAFKPMATIGRNWAHGEPGWKEPAKTGNPVDDWRAGDPVPDGYAICPGVFPPRLYRVQRQPPVPSSALRSGVPPGFQPRPEDTGWLQAAIDRHRATSPSVPPLRSVPPSGNVVRLVRRDGGKVPPVTTMSARDQDLWSIREKERAALAAANGVPLHDVRWNGTSFEVEGIPNPKGPASSFTGNP